VNAVTTGFAVFPAIDLRRGRCVRLEKGEAERETVYGDDPVAVAEGFAAVGAEWVHVVDLDAAFGQGDNRALVRRIAGMGILRVQTGGGLRSAAAIDAVLEAGAERVVVGTAAIENPALVREAVERWGAARVAVGLDARGQRPAVRGWREDTGADLFAVAASLVALGVRTLIHTDIERDGMMTGPNVALSATLAERSGAEVIVSGGIGSLADIEAAAARRGAGVAGAILGRAMYEGRVVLADALRVGGG
jgi:phosphoribosylformimino-5-aminoimidazole carboxamide ribotide isomerase